MGSKIENFQEYRKRMNKTILASENLEIKRFFNLDTSAYRSGKLDAKTKEMLGLAASAVLRCNDCILYHLIRCVEEGATDEELQEVMSIALVVGGSIVIPHLRFAFEMMEELRAKAQKDASKR